MPIKEYVVGFMFSEDREIVVLIQKTHPEFQKGLLNGPGGKIQPGESTKAAMVREFLEEAGQVTQEDEWNLYAVLTGITTDRETFNVYFLRAFRDNKEINRCYSATEERISQEFVCDMGNPAYHHLYVSNVPTYIIMALCMDRDDANMLQITEFYTDGR